MIIEQSDNCLTWAGPQSAKSEAMSDYVSGKAKLNIELDFKQKIEQMEKPP